MTSTTPAPEQRVSQLLALAVHMNASDIHIRADQVPMIRVAGELQAVEMAPLDAQTMRQIADQMTPASLREQARASHHLDFSAQWAGTARFRVHRFLVRNEPALVLRIIPISVPTFAQLRLPASIKRVAALDRGLVLITGATGMGKSTTIASILDYLSKNTRQHILSIEDPVEFTIGPGLSLVSQREVGRDTENFAAGLWSALRQDPDTIFIGEVRDRETVKVALQAAETGHLVISAIHTPDVVSTIEHVVSLFPTEEQIVARFRLAECLQAVLSQRLLPMKGLHQLVLVTELMLRSAGIQELIRRPERSRGIAEKIAASAPDGMHTFDQELRRLLDAGIIDFETARSQANSPSDFVRNMQVT